MMNQLGLEIVERSLKSMEIKPYLIRFLLIAGTLILTPLDATPYTQVTTQELAQEMRALHYQLKNLDRQVQQLHNQTETQEEVVEDLREAIDKKQKKSSTDQQWKEGMEQVIADLKTLRDHLQRLSSESEAASEKQKALEKHTTHLQAALNTLFDALEIPNPYHPAEDGHMVYEVKSGDSLGKIALQNKTTIKKIKELNHLKKDTIYIGQKLKLPKN